MTAVAAASLLVVLIFLAWAAARSRRQRPPNGDGPQREAPDALLDTLLDHCSDAVIVADAQGAITGWNRRAERLFGWKAGEVRGQHVADVILPPEARIAQRVEIELAREEGSTWSDGPVQVPILRRDGSQPTAALTRVAVPSPPGWRCVFLCHDLSERQRHAGEVQRLSLLAMRAGRLAFFLDRDGVCMWILDALPGGLGAAPEQALHRPFLDSARLLQLSEPVLRDVQRCLLEGQPLCREAEVTSRDGTPRSLRIELEPIAASADLPAGFIVVCSDITQRRRAEEVLQRANDHGVTAKLAHSLAHDFNNLLAAIVGHLDLAADAREPDAVAQHIAAALAAALRGRQVSDALRRAGSPPEPAPGAIDVGLALGEMMPLLRHAAGSDVTVKLDLAPSVHALADRGSFEAAMLALVANARDALPGGGKVTLSTYERRLGAGSESDLGIPRGDYVVVEVADDGVGMSEQRLHRSGEAFFSSKPERTSLPLGLSTVRTMVRKLGGTTRVFSAIGEGTCVQVYFPSAGPSGGDDAAAAADKENPFPRGTESVLVVENEPRLLSMTAEWLRGLGYTVQACESADEAAALLASREFDLLFTDAVMPGTLDGMDLVVRARELDPAQPVVLTSGFSAHHAEQRRDMALGYLQKPYSKSELAQTVRRGLDHGPHHPRATEARP